MCGHPKAYPFRRPCERRDPITTGAGCFCTQVVVFHFQQQWPRRMGPCVRRDDEDMCPHSRGASRPSFAVISHPLQFRGCRECRMHAAPAVSCAVCTEKCAHEHTGQRRQSDIPCAMALRLITCSPRRTALLPPLRPGKSNAPKCMDASNAASGPHVFTVRLSCARQAQFQRPPLPVPRCDDGQRPSEWDGMGMDMHRFVTSEKQNIFYSGS